MLARLVVFACGAAALAAAAVGQTSGPDVTVGDMPDIANATPVAVGSVMYDSFGLGTICCNKGDQTLNWKNSGTDSRHPVIAQNLFRLRNGRFEQIGQGWLKHAFNSLQGSLCESYLGFGCARVTTGVPPVTDGTLLPRGCSDTYSAALSNTNNLGPKWQVNAASGLFAFPPATSSAARGVRVRPEEFDTTGLSDRYFTETQYITADDAAAGNGANNASYREVALSGACCTGNICAVTAAASCTGAGTGWTISATCSPNQCGAGTGACCAGTTCNMTSSTICAALPGAWSAGKVCTPNPCAPPTDFSLLGIGTVTRELPAINAWRAADTSVVLSTFDVPGDGRFILASRVTGTGPYTYEYALHNLNSNRCAGSFSVALPATQGPLTNVGFHDVEYVLEPNALANPATPASDDWIVAGMGAGSAAVTWSGPAYSGTPATYTMSPTVPQQVVGFTAGAGNDHTANVLRWSTLFNFRFTTTVPPTTGAATVGLWRPGAGSSFAIAGLVPLVQPGACCVGTNCTITSAAGCTGTFAGSGSTCGGPGNPTVCCPANFNQIGGLTVQDIFDFLGAFFALDARADFNHAGGVNVQDIFDFLAAWFAGC